MSSATPSRPSDVHIRADAAASSSRDVRVRPEGMVARASFEDLRGAMEASDSMVVEERAVAPLDVMRPPAGEEGSGRGVVTVRTPRGLGEAEWRRGLEAYAASRE